MPTDELELNNQPQEQEEEESVEQQQAETFKPGELVPVDATNDRVDIDQPGIDEDGLTQEDKETCLTGLASAVSQRDLVSRRLQVRDAWKAGYFLRGNQHLLLGRNSAWVQPQEVLQGGQSYDDHNDETNIYLAFGDTIEAALTAGEPSVRFEANDPNNAAELDAASNASKYLLLIKRNNNTISLQGEIGRYLWTDGLSFVYTRSVINAKKYGYTHANIPGTEDELSYLPEEGGQGPAPLEGPMQPGGVNPDEGDPRTGEEMEAYGTLFVKVAIQANKLCESDYLQFSKEIDVNRGKAMYPEKAEEIQPAMAPTAESDYERLARTSIMMGMRPSSMTSDSMTYNCTLQKTWVQPQFFFEEKNDEKRAWLFKMFPKGAMVVMIGGVFCECRNEDFLEHWTLIHARPGDGMHRPALGSPIIPMQEKLNDCMDLVHESFMHLIPRIWLDVEQADLDALADTKRAPGQYFKMKRKGDKDLAGNFYQEPQIELASGLQEYIQNLFGEFSQFLCGAFPALFGGNTGSNDTAQGIASQRDQALGRIGLTWRNMKEGYASIMKQAVTCAAEHRKDVMTGTIKGGDGHEQQISVDPSDLRGNLNCFADTDENFPESWVAQRAIWMNLLQQAEKNPILQAILQTPRNMLAAKDKIGVPEVIIPGAESSRKQLGEIQILLTGQAQDNPEYLQAKQKLMAAIKAGPQNPEAVQIVTELGPQLQQMPQKFSTIQPLKLDNDAVEIQEIETWANSTEGIKAAKDNTDGYENVMIHYDEHEAAAARKAAGKSSAPQTKPVTLSLSANLKDLPPEGQVQAAAEFGIKLDGQKLMAEDAQDKVNERIAAAKPAAHALPVQ